MESRAIHTPINVALVGYGFVGKTFHAPLLVNVPGLRLSHIVSSDPAKVQKDHKDISVLAQPEDAFAHPDIDVIVLATPNDTHFPLAQKALRAGKHVVIDKPFTNTVAEAAELIKEARSQKRLLSAFQSRRWDGDFLTLRKLLADRAVGEVAEFESHYDRFRPEPRVRWREQPGPGSGIWYDLGAHLIDQVLQLFGFPDAVYADLGIQRPGGQAVDYFHVLLRYGTRRVILHGGLLVIAGTPRFTVHGTLGSYTKFGMDTQEDSFKRGDTPGSPGWGIDPNEGTLITKSGEGFETRQIPNITGNYLNYYERLRDAVAGGAPNPVPAEDAMEVINVIELAIKSSAARAELPFVPVKL
ncbi:MAG TPA: oxidoreductase [Candidatus Acidoferrales bacterium]